jgi:hypothetical protein
LSKTRCWGPHSPSIVAVVILTGPATHLTPRQSPKLEH